MKVKILFLLLLVFSFSCARQENGPGSSGVAVSSIRPEIKDLAAFTYFTGVARADQEVKVYPRVEGKIYEKLVRKGDSIEKGQILFTIDRDIIGHRFEKARVDSPISGRVGMIYVNLGDRVGPQEVLALVQSDSVIEVQIWVGERDYPLIREGQPAYFRVNAYPNQTFEGKVSEVSPFFDLNTHTALVKVRVDNSDGKIKPGMFTEIKIEVESRPGVLAILFDSVLEDTQGEYVYLVKEAKAKKRYIETGLLSGNYLEVISGLEEEAEIVYRGKEFLEDGLRIKAVPD